MIKEKTKQQDQSVKMNLTLSREFYETIKEYAKNDYAKPATWTKIFLMKNLLQNKPDFKFLTQNENIKQ